MRETGFAMGFPSNSLAKPSVFFCAGQGDRGAVGPERAGGEVGPGGEQQGSGWSSSAVDQSHPKAYRHGVRNARQGSVASGRRASVQVRAVRAWAELPVTHDLENSAARVTWS